MARTFALAIALLASTALAAPAVLLSSTVSELPTPNERDKVIPRKLFMFVTWLIVALKPLQDLSSRSTRTAADTRTHVAPNEAVSDPSDCLYGMPCVPYPIASAKPLSCDAEDKLCIGAREVSEKTHEMKGRR